MIKGILFDLDNTLYNQETKNKVKKIIRVISRKYKIGIVTNSNINEAIDKVNSIGIEKHIDFIISPKKNIQKKPLIYMFVKAKVRLNINYSDILFVGDHLINDIFPAKICGMKTALIKNIPKKYHKIISKPYINVFFGPDFLITKLSDVLLII